MKVERYVVERVRVYVDVFTWALNAQNYGVVPMEGIYRHAEALARRYEPAIWLTENEPVPEVGLDMIEAKLGRGVLIFREGKNEGLDSPFIVWLSPALDGVSPAAAADNEIRCTRVAVVHDLMSLRGEFGAANKDRCLFGLRNTEYFMPVSQTVRNELHCWFKSQSFPPPNTIDYSGFHNEDVLGISLFPFEKKALGVATIYPRKEVFRTFAIARALGYTYSHVGRYAALSRNDNHQELFYYNCLLQPAFKFMGTLPDPLLRLEYASAEAFFNFSSDEGFSLTPLEAIIYGVPRIYISDIAVHRELYSERWSPGIHLVSSGEADDLLSGARKPTVFTAQGVISQHCRRTFFDRYKFTNAIGPFEKWIHDTLTPSLTQSPAQETPKPSC